MTHDYNCFFPHFSNSLQLFALMSVSFSLVENNSVGCKRHNTLLLGLHNLSHLRDDYVWQVCTDWKKDLGEQILLWVEGDGVDGLMFLRLFVSYQQAFNHPQLYHSGPRASERMRNIGLYPPNPMILNYATVDISTLLILIVNILRIRFM